eukprot:jgi/Chrpa1/8331/Chrysochromulina_OHIO_Genome00013842-RA
MCAARPALPVVMCAARPALPAETCASMAALPCSTVAVMVSTLASSLASSDFTAFGIVLATSCMPCASPCATPRMAPSLRAAFEDARISSSVKRRSCFEVLDLPAALPGAEPKASRASTTCSAAKFSGKEGSTRAKAVEEKKAEGDACGRPPVQV